MKDELAFERALTSMLKVRRPNPPNSSPGDFSDFQCLLEAVAHRKTERTGDISKGMRAFEQSQGDEDCDSKSAKFWLLTTVARLDLDDYL